jgi:pectinesterase
MWLLMLAAVAAAPPTATTGKSKVRIVLAGDSTVTDKAGWGLGFARALGDHAEVVNLSAGGRSSKSFRDEGRWAKVIEAKGDIVLVQFGHNDQPGKGPERETDPKTTFRENLARYVGEARAAGAKPVLVTSLSRRKWTGDDKLAPSDLTEYVEAAKAVAAEKKVPLIDLHASSRAEYEKLGRAVVESMSPKKDDGTVDGTHLNEAGGKVIGEIVADELKRIVPGL